MECDSHKPWWVRQLDGIARSVFTAGTAIAVVQSWEKFHSVWFSLYAGVGNWFYVWFPGAFDQFMK